MPPGQTANQSLADKKISAFKNKPLVATLIAFGVLSLAFLTWLSSFIETSKKVAVETGLSAAPEFHVQRNAAYNLGKNVAWMSFFKTELYGKQVPPELETSINQKMAEIESELKTLGVSADPTNLDYRSLIIENYQDSAATNFLMKSVRASVGESVVSFYRLGEDIEGSYYTAKKNRFTSNFTTGITGSLLLEGLNSEAQRLGCQGLDHRHASLADAENDDALNRELAIALTVLDGQIQEKL